MLPWCDLQTYKELATVLPKPTLPGQVCVCLFGHVRCDCTARDPKRFFILKWWDKIMDMTHKNSIKFAFYCPKKVSFLCIQLCSLDYALHKAAFGIQWQSWAELTENICPSLPTMAMYGKDVPVPEKQWITFIRHTEELLESSGLLSIP